MLLRTTPMLKERSNPRKMFCRVNLKRELRCYVARLARMCVRETEPRAERELDAKCCCWCTCCRCVTADAGTPCPALCWSGSCRNLEEHKRCRMARSSGSSSSSSNNNNNNNLQTCRKKRSKRYFTHDVPSFSRLTPLRSCCITCSSSQVWRAVWPRKSCGSARKCNRS